MSDQIPTLRGSESTAASPGSRDAVEQRLAEFGLALEHELLRAPEQRRELHREPRRSGDEHDTAEIFARMTGLQLTPVADTGRVARIGPAQGPAVAIRAELDALPISEQTGVDWAATNGLMHACGHDVHQAALVALANAAQSVGTRLPLAIVPLLQPREEAYPSGAKDIVDSSVLQETGVLAVLGAHVHPRVPLGEIAVGLGPINAAADTVEIRFTGGGGHGAYPHEARNPVLALAHTVVTLEGLVRRSISPMHPAVISVGHVVAGDAANVVPEVSSLLATVRTMFAADRQLLLDRISEEAKRHATQYAVEASITVDEGEPVLENSPELVREFQRLAASEGRELPEPMRSCGSDDFSYYSAHFLSLMSFVGVQTDGLPEQPSLHHSKFLPQERAIADVARALFLQYSAVVHALPDREGLDT